MKRSIFILTTLLTFRLANVAMICSIKLPFNRYHLETVLHHSESCTGVQASLRVMLRQNCRANQLPPFAFLTNQITRNPSVPGSCSMAASMLYVRYERRGKFSQFYHKPRTSRFLQCASNQGEIDAHSEEPNWISEKPTKQVSFKLGHSLPRLRDWTLWWARQLKSGLGAHWYVCQCLPSYDLKFEIKCGLSITSR